MKIGVVEGVRDSGIREFQEFLADSNLQDLGFTSNPFTWKNIQRGSEHIFEHLDRAVATATWIHAFPHHFVRHLPRLNSDDAPTLLAEADSCPPGNYKFRFENFWIAEPGLRNIIQQMWQSTVGLGKNLEDSLRTMAATLAAWHKHTFGHAKSAAHRIERQLEGIENQSCFA